MKLFYFIIISIALISCTGKNDVPLEVIQKKEMQNILWDVIKAQALSSEISRKDSSINEVAETKMLTQKVYEIHDVTPSSFDKSYSWYLNHPELLKVIFDSMYNQNQTLIEKKLKKGNHPFNNEPTKKIGLQ